MKKITLLILTIFLSFASYGQFFEGFESTNAPNLGTDQWNLGSTGLNSDGIWGVFDNGVGIGQSWTVTTAPAQVYQGVQSAFMNRENVGAGALMIDYLATPLVTIPTNGQLSFFTRTTLTGNQGTVYKIMVSTTVQNDPAAYVEIKSWTESELTATFNVYEEKKVSLTTYAGQNVYVAFVMEFTQPTAALSGDRWLLDNVRIVPQCLDPINLVAQNIGLTTAELTWGNPSGATEWEIMIVPFSTVVPPYSGVTYSGTLPYIATQTTVAPITPFAPSTQYKYYVRALCGDDVNSEWVGPTAFTTSSPGLTCNAPIEISGTPFSTTDTTGAYGDTTDVTQPINCAGDIGNFMFGNDVFYSYTPTESGAISIEMTPTGGSSGIFVYDGCANVGVDCEAGVANFGTTPRIIPSMDVIAGHEYIIVISTAGFPQTVGYTLIIQTLNCAPPTGLSATGTGPNSVDLSWQNPSGSTSWEVFVQNAGSPLPTTGGVIATTNVDFEVTTVTDSGQQLVLGTPYQYWVRADCGDGTFSPWSGPYQFSTSACSSGCNFTFEMVDGFGDGWNGSLMDIIQQDPDTGADIVIATIGDTFTGGAAQTVSVPLCAGPFQVVWTDGGVFPGEVGVTIKNSFGQGIFTMPPFSGTQPGAQIFSGVVDCDNPLCLPPLNLIVSDITTFGAELSWTPNGPVPASWDVYAVPVGNPAPTDTTVPDFNTTSNPFVITGLLADTEYVYYVRAVCDLPGANPWSAASAPFTTLPTCPKPTGLTFISATLTSATFDWTDGGLESSWEVIAVPAGDPAPAADATGWTPAPSHPFTLTPLTQGTAYDFYVRGVCTPTDSSTWAGPLPFNTTVCDPIEQCLYTFTLTDSFGDGWNGNTLAIIQNGVTVATLGSTFTTGAGPIVETVALCHGVAFDVFWNIGGNFANEVGFSITSALGQVIYTKAFGVGAQGTTLYSDTGECTAPTCLEPTNVIVTSTLLNTAMVSWTENNIPAVTAWDVIVLPSTAPAPTQDATGWVTATSNPYEITGLDPATNYTVYVRSNCSDTDKSFWSLGDDFNTQVCLPSTLCEYTFIMQDTFGDTWNGNTMSVTQNGILIATLTGPTFADGQSPVSLIVPLCNNVPFELFWNTGGFFANEVAVSITDQSGVEIFSSPAGSGAQGTLLFSGTVQCVPFTCPKPVQLLATNVTETSATLNWVEANTATEWEILILPAGSPAPTPATPGIPTGGPSPYEATDLLSGTQYVFYVRAICSDTDISNWSLPYPFATLITNDDCDTATVVGVNPDQSCVLTASGTLIGATQSDVPSTCFGTADDDVWYQFTATSTSHSIALNDIQGSQTFLEHVLYSGDDCGNLTQIYCSTDTQSVATTLVPGQTYFVRVYSYFSDPATTTFTLCIGTIPPAITVNQTDYTEVQLIESVLLNSTCAGVSNITWSTGTNFNSVNGIGYFERNGSSFPFENGVVLSTGDANQAAGPNSTGQSNGDFGWPGDADLQAIVAAGGNPNQLNNATVYEFDFVPVTDNMSFRFLFASEEYGVFQCTFSDVFAFLLTDLNTGITTNLAVIPTTTTPVSVVTVRDSAFNNGCASVNPEYFGDYYGIDGAGLSPLASPTNFNGITIPMTASSPVIPGNSYHIKLAIADYSDSAFDSAVFIEGGTFGIGNIDLGENLLESTGNALCAGEDTVIDTNLDSNIYSFAWSFNGVPTGDTGNSIIATQEGEYTLNVNFIGTDCVGVDSVLVEFYDPIVPGTANDLFICNASGTGVFDLTLNTPVVLAPFGTGYIANYFLTEADANGNLNPILNPTAYTNTSNPQIIWVRIENIISGCYAVVSFQLIVQDLTPQFTFPDDFSLCAGETGTISVTPINFTVTEATYSWTLDGVALADTDDTITVTVGGVYEVTVDRQGCSSTDSVTVTIVPAPVVTTPGDQTACEQYVLPALTVGGYFAQQGGISPITDTTITETQTIWVYAADGSCFDEESFVVTINDLPVIAPISDVVACSTYTLPALPAGSSYHTATGGTSPLASTTITGTGVYTIFVYAETGTVPNCSSELSFTVTITDAIVLAPIANVSQCDPYTLPALIQGSYYSSTGGVNPITDLTITTSQTVYVYAQSGTCSDEKSFTVTINAAPVFTVNGGCQGANYVLEPIGGPFEAGATYAWTSVGGSFVSDVNGPTATVSGAGEYTLTITSSQGCASSYPFDVDSTSCTIQKGISANGDGVNDTFDLTGQGVTQLEIFNRYGMVVYKRQDYVNEWGGQSDKDGDLPDGTYYYVIERGSGETITGWIYINRDQN